MLQPTTFSTTQINPLPTSKSSQEAPLPVQSSFLWVRLFFERLIKGVKWVWSVIWQKGTIVTIAGIAATSKAVGYFSPTWGRRVETWALRFRVAWGDIHSAQTEQELQAQVAQQKTQIKVQKKVITDLVVQNAGSAARREALELRLGGEAALKKTFAARNIELAGILVTKDQEIAKLQAALKKMQEERDAAIWKRDEANHTLGLMTQPRATEEERSEEANLRKAFDTCRGMHETYTPKLQGIANACTDPVQKEVLNAAIETLRGLVQFGQVSLLPSDQDKQRGNT